jgi:DNA-binding transcriptional ArsR family regulator
VRLEIVRTLGKRGETSCGGLGVTVSKSTLTHHLKVLRDAGLTQTRCEGVQRLVSLREQDVEARFPGLLSCVLAHHEPGNTQAAAQSTQPL